MGVIYQWLKDKWPPVVLAIYWGVHIYIWLIWGWKDTELFNSAWWFDEAGHALFGVTGALTLLYFYRTYSLHGIFRFAGKKHLTKDIVEDVAIFGILWEFGEMIWDLYFQPNFIQLAMAQKGVIDTVIDLVVNPIFALITLVIYFSCARLYARIYERNYPDDKNTAAVEGEVEETLEMLRYVSQKVRSLRKEHLKHLRPTLKEIVHFFREGKKNTKTA